MVSRSAQRYIERLPEEAEEALSRYGWFAEGFDTPDLVDAKALLEELA